jgi:hypothetical protein
MSVALQEASETSLKQALLGLEPASTKLSWKLDWDARLGLQAEPTAVGQVG